MFKLHFEICWGEFYLLFKEIYLLGLNNKSQEARMLYKLLGAGLSLLIAGVFGLAASSIGTECYNKNDSFKQTKINNFNFLIVNIVSAILLILLGSASMYFGVYA